MYRDCLRKILEENSLSDVTGELERLVNELIARYDPALVMITGSLARREFVRRLSNIDLIVVEE